MKDLYYKILWSVIEDYVGLWEILWEVMSILSENSQEENKKIAKRILKYFLEHGLVNIYTDKWGFDELKEMDINQGYKLIDYDKNWIAPSISDFCVKIGNTEKGERFYKEKILDNLNIE